MVLNILTKSHRPSATATNAANLSGPPPAPYVGAKSTAYESRLATATDNKPAFQPTQMQTAATATSKPDISFANNASRTLAAPIVAATTRRCLEDVNFI